jgi:hypothetical protein
LKPRKGRSPVRLPSGLVLSYAMMWLQQENRQFMGLLILG